MNKIIILILFILLMSTSVDASTFVNNNTTAGWTTSNISLNGSRWDDNGSIALNLRNDSSLNIFNKLMAYYSFDESSGTIAHQMNTESGLINTTNAGTLTNMNSGLDNGASGWNSTGKIGNSLSFDGTNDYVNIGTDASLSLGTDDFTIGLCAKTTTQTGFSPIGSVRITAPYTGYYVYGLSSSTIRFHLGDTTAYTDFTMNATIGDNNMHCIVFSVTRASATGLKLYVDGALADTKDPTARQGNINNGVTDIGQDSASDYSKGIIDEVYIWRRALNASEVATLYNTSIRNMAMPLILNQKASVGNVINSTCIGFTTGDSSDNASIYGRKNGTSTWGLIQANTVSGTCYDNPSNLKFNSMDFGIMEQGNGSKTVFFNNLTWYEQVSTALKTIRRGMIVG
jgi:hypothetical protein